MSNIDYCLKVILEITVFSKYCFTKRDPKMLKNKIYIAKSTSFIPSCEKRRQKSYSNFDFTAPYNYIFEFSCQN